MAVGHDKHRVRYFRRSLTRWSLSLEACRDLSAWANTFYLNLYKRYSLDYSGNMIGISTQHETAVVTVVLRALSSPMGREEKRYAGLSQDHEKRDTAQHGLCVPAARRDEGGSPFPLRVAPESGERRAAVPLREGCSRCNTGRSRQNQ